MASTHLLSCHLVIGWVEEDAGLDVLREKIGRQYQKDSVGKVTDVKLTESSYIYLVQRQYSCIPKNGVLSKHHFFLIDVSLGLATRDALDPSDTGQKRMPRQRSHTLMTHSSTDPRS